MEGTLEGIVDKLLRNDKDWFKCHKSIGLESKEHRNAQCVGSMIYLLKCDSPSVSMRLAAMFGKLDYAELRAQYANIIEPFPKKPFQRR